MMCVNSVIRNERPSVQPVAWYFYLFEEVMKLEGPMDNLSKDLTELGVTFTARSVRGREAAGLGLPLGR